MVELARLESVVGCVSTLVGSNPILSARKYFGAAVLSSQTPSRSDKYYN